GRSGGRVPGPKRGAGGLGAGAPPLDVVAALLSIRDRVVPATVHVDRPAAHHRLDLVRGSPRELPVRAALVLARGHGGFNAALVVRAPAEPDDRDRQPMGDRP